jgi:hypothetical protein
MIVRRYVFGAIGIAPYYSAANLNTHLHGLALDGVYQTSEDEGAPVFIEATAPSNEQLQTVLDPIIRRILKLLTRLGHLIEEDGITGMARTGNIDPQDVMAPLQAASSTWRIASGPRAGRKVLTIAGHGERSKPHQSRDSVNCRQAALFARCCKHRRASACADEYSATTSLNTMPLTVTVH